MKLKLTLLSICSLLLTAPYIANAEPVSTQPAPASQTQPQSNEEAQIIGFLIAVNKNEIAVSNEVLKRTTNPMVKEYATMLRNDHTKNLIETVKLSDKINQKPTNMEITESLKIKGKEKLDQLKSADKAQFDRIFIDAMVEGHEKALGAIDENINKVNNPMLKKLLVQTKGTVQKHLEMAKKIQNQLSQTH